MPAQWLDCASMDYSVHVGGELPMVAPHPRRPQDVAFILGTAPWLGNVGLIPWILETSMISNCNQTMVSLVHNPQT